MQDEDADEGGHLGKLRGQAPGTISGFTPLNLTLLLTALGAALRFSALTAQSFWYDEAVSVSLARNSLFDLLSGRARDLGNPPLYPALLHVWMSLFGSGDAATRSLSAVLGTATIPVVIALGREVFPARVAFLAGTLLAVSPFHLQMAQEARAYTLLAFLGAAATLALVRATQEPARAGRWALLAVITAAMVLTHYFGAFLALAQVAYLLVVHRHDRAVLARATAAYLGAFALFALWLPAFFAQVGVEGNLARSAESWYLHLVATPLVFGLGTTLVWKDAASWPRLLVGGLGALAFVAAVGIGLYRTFSTVVISRARQNPRALLVLLWLVVPIALPAIISVLLSPLYNTRYVIMASLPFLLFAAAGIEQLPGRARMALAGVLMLAMGASTLSYLRRPVKHQWREAAAFVEAARRPDDLLLFEADYNETAYAHYAGPAVPTGKVQRLRLMPPPAGAADADGAKLFGVSQVGAAPTDVSAAVAGQDRVWLILADASRDQAARVHAFLAAARPAYVARPPTTLRGITVQLFERP